MTHLPATDLLPPRSAALGLMLGSDRLADLLAHSPADPQAVVSAARVAASRALDRDGLVEALLAGLTDLEAPEPAREAARRLADPRTVVVVAGQQPGLLGGPLMILVKALAAAAVAARLEREGVPAVPVFWHASEDHDHGEADHVLWPGADGPERLRLPLPEDRRMLSAVEVPERAGELVERMLAELPDGPGRAVLEGVLPPRSAESFGTWTGRLVARVLGVHGIVVVEPHRLRSLALPVAREELAEPGALFAGIQRAVARVTAAGFDAPLSLRRPELLFHVDRASGARRPVSFEGTPPGEWLRRLDADPRAFSWNVAARVLAQDVALPVAAQICGPAELGYVALMREGHAALGVPQPAALLRPGLTLVERPVLRAYRKMEVRPRSVASRIADVVASGADAFPPLGLDADGALTAFRAALEELPLGSSPASRRRRNELVRQAGLYEEALRREAEDAAVTVTRRRRTILDGIRPMGRPMERVVSFLPWFARMGDDFCSRLLDRLGTGEPVHHVISSEDL